MVWADGNGQLSCQWQRPRISNPEPRISFCCCSLRLDKNLKRLSHCPPVEGPLSAILCNRQLCQSSFISQFSFVLLHTHAVIILHSGRQGDSRLHFHSISTLTGSLGTPSSMELHGAPTPSSILHSNLQFPSPCQPQTNLCQRKYLNSVRDCRTHTLEKYISIIGGLKNFSYIKLFYKSIFISNIKYNNVLA